MCLSNIYRESDNELLMENTSRIDTVDGLLVIRNLFGETVTVDGVITAVDFEKNTVVIRCAE